jgi:inner membrane protein
MDNLTHTLIGLTLSRAGLGRNLPRAGLLLAAAANMADIDVVCAAGGSLTYLDWHRGLTHSVFAVPLLAVLPVVIARLASRSKPFPWLRAYLVSLAAAATHPLLDWTNVYGVRLLEPFSAQWHMGGFTYVFDVWIWAVLAVALIWPRLSGLVSSEIGARPASGRGLAILALCFVAAYEGGRALLHQRALATLDSRIYEGAVPLRVVALPSPVSPLRWTGVVEGERFWSLHDLNLREEFDPTLGRTYYKPEPSPALDAARRDPVFQRYLRFAQLVLWRVTPLDRPDGARRVEAMDLRFGPPSAPRFIASAVVPPDGRAVDAVFRFREAEAARRR